MNHQHLQLDRVSTCVMVILLLSACSASGEPDYCNQGVGERGLSASGYNPVLIGPALIVSAVMELGCNGDSQPASLQVANRPLSSEPVAMQQWRSLCRRAVVGEGQAQSAIASHYRHGWDPVEQDLLQAYKWYGLAFNAGYTEATTYRDEMAEEMSVQQIAEAERLLSELEPDLASCEIKLN